MCKWLKWWTSDLYRFPSLITPSAPQYPDKSELFPGVTKPSVTLAHMLVSEMFQNLDAKSDMKIQHKGEGYERNFMVYVFPSFRVEVDHGYTSHHFPPNLNTTFVISEGPVKNIIFTEEELLILDSGFTKFQKLQKKSLDIRKEAERQQAAIDAIAAMLPKSQEKDELCPVV